MNPRALIQLGLAAIFAASFAPKIFAQSVTTVPVGFQSITIPAASGSTPSRTLIGISLQPTPVDTGLITSATNSTLTNSSANWTTNYASSPYLVKVMTGAGVGRFFLITSNTTSQLTVATQGVDLGTVVSPGDRYQISPANTLGSLFGTTTVQFQTGDSASTADNVLIWNGTTFATYYNDTTGWQVGGSFSSQNNTIIYPDEGFFVVHRNASPITVTFTGIIPSTAERTLIPGSGGDLVAQRFPTDTTLGSLNLNSLTGWVSSDSASTSDNVLLWNGTTSTWDTYYYDNTGPNWAKGGSFSAQDSTAIPAGSAFFIRRKSGSTAGTIYLTGTLPYTLN